MHFGCLAPVLKQLRQRRGLTGRDVSRMLNKSPAYVNNLEHARDLPSIETLLQLAAEYRAPPERLLKLRAKDAVARWAEQLAEEHEAALSAWKSGGKKAHADAAARCKDDSQQRLPFFKGP